MHSCIYEGRVAHCRSGPVRHRFQYRLMMVYLDLDELPELLGPRRLLSDRRLACAAFLRSDHLKGSSASLDEALRQLVEDQTGTKPLGPIRLLTQLRCFGHYFSPLNLFYCFAADRRTVEAIVAEVNNTPWGEQHCYVLWEGNRTDSGTGLRFAHAKSLHVSPFMEMDVEYHWRVSTPDERLCVEVTSTRRGVPFFRATLALRRRPLTRPHLARVLVRYPLMTLRIVGAIYFEALRLWWKKCPFHPHPGKRQPASRTPV